MKDLIKCYCGHTTTCDCIPEQERSYSEEEMRECYEFAIENVQLGRNGYEWITFEEWFEQFKKK
jgi:hypothetical protein